MKDLAKIEEIYHAALELTPAERDEFLKSACGDDEELRCEVESIISSYESAGNFIESPPEDIAADFFTNHVHENLAGKEFSHYRILSQIGMGGMGEVYLAEDTKLGRKVALKLLPPQFSKDAERKRRFEQEARAISALNHPNIITIHGIEQTDEFSFIATEFIEGQTLREKVEQGKLSWQETVKIGTQIASALESAHSVGIIHRDIKPANIMIRRDGIVKVLDFGLAKLAESEASEVRNRDWRAENKPLVQEFNDRFHKSHITNPNSQLTIAGTIMGTINYMSPEQTSGETLDGRTDIFSFGVVLYEMLAGVKPFDGASDAAVYNATINHNPPSLSTLNHNIPVSLDKIIFHAIEKKQADRYQTISELKRDLQEIKEAPIPDLVTQTFAVKEKSNFAKVAIPILSAVLLSATAYFLIFNRSSNQLTESKNFTYSQLTSQNGEELFPNLSPDGKFILYSSRESGNWDIYLKQIDGSTQINLTKNSTADDKEAVFSPDGKQIAFRSERDGGGIFVMSSSGENVRRITDVGFYPNWSPDGKEIAFCIDDFSEPGSRTTVPSHLWKVKVETGERLLISKQDAAQPNWSPNGERIAFWGLDSGGRRDVWTISANGGEPIAVTNDATIDWNPVWSNDGRSLYFVSNRSGSMNLWRVEIDESSGKVLGNPEPITIPSNYSGFFNFSRDGKSFVYVQTVNYSNIFKIDFNSQTETVGKAAVEITRGSKITTNPEISTDNQFLTFDNIGDKQEDVFIAKADGSEIRQLTNDVYKDRAPHWSPDGKRIAFFSDETGKYEGYVMNTDGSGRKMVSQLPPNSWVQLPVWSPDGKRLIFNTRNSYPAIFDPDKEGAAQTPQFLPDEGDPKRWFMAFSWSPDGKKLIGYGRDTEKPQSYLMTYNFTTNKYETVSEFGTRALWLADNKCAIFYHNDKIYLLDTETKRRKELLSVAPNRIQSISLSKDNRTIYYSVQKNESDIWLANPQ
ncbi:MAG TPA: protein kinase [Pyrinomonadaceae bacterium]|nr:protein kinase [Pyrinomonadaceae bacterium]